MSVLVADSALLRTATATEPVSKAGSDGIESL
jgi:hypothetical protein